MKKVELKTTHGTITLTLAPAVDNSGWCVALESTLEGPPELGADSDWAAIDAAAHYAGFVDGVESLVAAIYAEQPALRPGLIEAALQTALDKAEQEWGDGT